MTYWVYKCNARSPDYAGSWGDWREHVFKPGGTRSWGLSTLKGVAEITVGDVLIAYQTDRNELVGTARVLRLDPEKGAFRLVITPTEEIGAKVRPLKKDPKIAALQAFKPGDIRTAYGISAAEAKYLLDAARKSIRSKQQPPVGAKQRTELAQAFAELPVKDRRMVIRLIRLATRNAALRSKVLQIWPSRCAACGFEIRDGDGNSECEVAHIQDVHAKGSDLIANSIPLCRTHHWAFDRGLWAIHPTSLTITVVASAKKYLSRIHGRKVIRPAAINDIEPLAAEHLAWRWLRFKA